ncbi:MAG: DNA primase [Gammaproteobacteria bacterium]|nr:DNA primase [Gammaproteobacteria bacterium]
MAGLIPQAFIDDLLSRSDIIDVVDKRVTLKKTGANYSALCPFHKEKSPSFSVQPERQFYYCFGCGAGGNAIGFIMNFDQVDFPQAVETLARDNGMEVPREQNQAAARKQSEHAKIYEVLERASKFYQFQLRKHEQRAAAVDYLTARGVSGEIARDFGIGYAPPGWDNLLAAIGSDAAEQANLLKAGMVIEKDRSKTEDSAAADSSTPHYYDRFRHRIMFPIRDSRGRTIAFGGRVLGNDKPKYLNSPETPVFHKGGELYGLYECKKASGKHKRMLLVEGYMDVIALAQMGIRNAVATLGTATSSTHLTRLFRLVPEIVFCFDGDNAGRTAAWRALESVLPLMEDGRQVRFLFLPEGEDPDTLVRAIGRDAFNARIAPATPLEKFFFDKLSQDLDVNTIEGKARLSNLAKPLIKRFPQGVYGQLMLDRLSSMLGVNKESLQQLLVDKVATAAAPPSVAPPFASSSQQRSGAGSNRSSANGLAAYRKPASLKAIELLLRNPEIALHLEQDLTPLASPLATTEDESRKLLLSLIQLVRDEPSTETFTMLGYCYGTSLGGQLTQLLKSETITPTEGLEEEFNQILDNILSEIVRTMEHLQLKDQLNSRFGATKD